MTPCPSDCSQYGSQVSSCRQPGTELTACWMQPSGSKHTRQTVSRCNNWCRGRCTTCAVQLPSLKHPCRKAYPPITLSASQQHALSESIPILLDSHNGYQCSPWALSPGSACRSLTPRQMHDLRSAAISITCQACACWSPSGLRLHRHCPARLLPLLLRAQAHPHRQPSSTSLPCMAWACMHDIHARRSLTAGQLHDLRSAAVTNTRLACACRLYSSFSKYRVALLSSYLSCLRVHTHRQPSLTGWSRPQEPHAGAAARPAQRGREQHPPGLRLRGAPPARVPALPVPHAVLRPGAVREGPAGPREGPVQGPGGCPARRGQQHGGGVQLLDAGMTRWQTVGSDASCDWSNI